MVSKLKKDAEKTHNEIVKNLRCSLEANQHLQDFTNLISLRWKEGVQGTGNRKAF